MEEQDEQALVEAIGAGDVDALARFIELRRRALYAFIERNLGAALRSKVEADDIFQETAADAVRSLPSIELGDRDPFSWLCQVAQRRIIDAHRRLFGAQKRAAGREVPLSGGADSSSRAAVIDMIVASMTTPSAAFSRDIRQMKLHDALGQMPEDQREALRLKYLEGLPSKEIAKRLNKSDGAIRVMISRSLGKLQALLGPDAKPRDR